MAALTQEQVEARCLANGYQWPDGFVYKNSKTKYPLVCLTCGDETPKRFGTVGTDRCKGCYVLAQRFTHKEAEAKGLAGKHPAQLLEPYKGSMKVKHRYRFLDCPEQHEVEVAPNDIHKGRGCGACAFDPGPTYVYLMEHEEWNAYKVGVTGANHGEPSASRIYKHGLDGWTLVHKERHETRAEALAREAAVLDFYSDVGPALEQGVMRCGGEGETLFRDQVDVDQIISMM